MGDLKLPEGDRMSYLHDWGRKNRFILILKGTDLRDDTSAKSNLDVPKHVHEDLDKLVRSRHLSAHHQDGFYPSIERVQNGYGTVKEIMRLFVEKGYFED